MSAFLAEVVARAVDEQVDDVVMLYAEDGTLLAVLAYPLSWAALDRALAVGRVAAPSALLPEAPP